MSVLRDLDAYAFDMWVDGDNEWVPDKVYEYIWYIIVGTQLITVNQLELYSKYSCGTIIWVVVLVGF